MAWKLTGQLVESCSCNMLCPCWYAVQDLMIMDRGWCATPWLLRIGSGESDGTEIPPLDAVITAIYPGPTLFDGNGTGRLYFDESLDADIRSLLEPILQGQRGGPPEILAGLMSKWLPSTMTMSKTGFALALRFDDALAELAPSDGTRWNDPDLHEAFECKSGVVGQFTWSD